MLEGNFFEKAFINVMHILQANKHVLFEAIEKGMGFYPCNRGWANLAQLTHAWRIHCGLITMNKGEIHELDDNIFESVFGETMLILLANNHLLFTRVVEASDEEDEEIIGLAHAWRIWCDQNTHKCSVEGNRLI